MKSLTMFRPALLLIGSAIGSTAVAKPVEGRFELLTYCAAGASHVEQSDCLERKLKASFAALQSAEVLLIDKLRSVDQEAQEKQRAITAAETDSQAYVSYSQTHCEAFGALAFGGNSQHDRRLACQIEMNAIRTRQLSLVVGELLPSK